MANVRRPSQPSTSAINNVANTAAIMAGLPSIAIYFRFAASPAISRACSMNSFATGLTVRFFSVKTAHLHIGIWQCDG